MEDKTSELVTCLDDLIATGERFLIELDEVENNQPEESPISVVNQRKLDKMYEQGLDILKELRSISREVRKKIKSDRKPLKSISKQKPPTVFGSKESSIK